uniref:hypothetical protein n=1 Tax=Pyramidobacter sp. C12-8 TaxID=1943580 RepID=UPI00210F80DD|nr:hypothetical protein [Pyramidobacter sp. C12-8]
MAEEVRHAHGRLPAVFEFRAVGGRRHLQIDEPLLRQLHQRQRGERLGHRGQAEDRVLADGQAARRVAEAEKSLIGRTAPIDDGDGKAAGAMSRYDLFRIVAESGLFRPKRICHR